MTTRHGSFYSLEESSQLPFSGVVFVAVWPFILWIIFADDPITCCTCLACIPADYCVCRPLWCPPLLTGYGDASEKIKVPFITALGNHWTITLYVIYTSPFASCTGFVTGGDSHQLSRRGIYFTHSQIDSDVPYYSRGKQNKLSSSLRGRYICTETNQ